MPSHYLFFEGKDAINLIDTLKPRKREGKAVPKFDFSLRHDENQFGDLCFVVITDAQLDHLQGHGRQAQEGRGPIYAVNNMVSARLVDFTSRRLEAGVRAFRADFYSPARKKFFAYATPYGKNDFGIRMHQQTGLDLEMLPFLDYRIGDPIGKAVSGTFATYYTALANHDAFKKYQSMGLALIAPAKLIEK